MDTTSSNSRNTQKQRPHYSFEEIYNQEVETAKINLNEQCNKVDLNEQCSSLDDNSDTFDNEQCHHYDNYPDNNFRPDNNYLYSYYDDDTYASNESTEQNFYMVPDKTDQT